MGTAEIRGTARLPTGTFPTSLKRWAVLYRDGKYYFGVQVDSRGRFMFQHVAAGNYRLALDLENEGSQRISARGEQMVEVINDKVSEVFASLEP